MIRIKGVMHRKLGPDEHLQAGDYYRKNTIKRPVWDRMIMTYPDEVAGTWSVYDFYREVDPLIAAMYRVRNKRKK